MGNDNVIQKLSTNILTFFEKIGKKVVDVLKEIKARLCELFEEIKNFLKIALNLDASEKGVMSFRERFKLWKTWRTRNNIIKKLLVLFGVKQSKSFERHMLLKRAYSDCVIAKHYITFYEKYEPLEEARYSF